MRDMKSVERYRAGLQSLRESAKTNSYSALFLRILDVWNNEVSTVEDREYQGLIYAWLADFDGITSPLDIMLDTMAYERIKVSDELFEDIERLFPITDDERNDKDHDGIIWFLNVQRELRGLPAA